MRPAAFPGKPPVPAMATIETCAGVMTFFFGLQLEFGGNMAHELISLPNAARRSKEFEQPWPIS